MYKILILLMCLFLAGCGDRIQGDSSDLEKYPWVATFALEGKNFSKVEHNLDTGRYAFSFRSDLSPEEYFSAVDDCASQKGWVVSGANIDSRNFERPSTVFAAAEGKETVSLEYKDEGEIFLEYWPNVTAD